MTIRPARTGLAAAGALLAASLAAPAFAQGAPAQPQSQAPAQGAPAQQPQMVSPQAWPQCVIVLEKADDMAGGPNGAAATADAYRASLDILVEESDVTQAQVDEIDAQVRAGIDDVGEAQIVQAANACMAGAPDPERLEIRPG